MSALPAVIKRDVDPWTFEIYVTDTLQAIAENTAVPASGFTDGKHGRVMTRRWVELDKLTEKDERTGDDIDRELSMKFGWEVKSDESV